MERVMKDLFSFL